MMSGMFYGRGRGVFCFAFALLTAVFFLPAATHAVADDDIGAQEQAAWAAAVDRVAPAVVQIETIGGQEQVRRMLFGTGPTTGLVVDPEGYIVSSAFNFVNKPESILVRLPGGALRPAKLVATDHSRMLVLLKVDVEKPLPVGQIAPRREMRVGQWAIAVGRTFESQRPNMAVGILSALNRIWGKAIQTDAALSPNNYGGPLVDIQGRVMGVIVPLDSERADEIAGVDKYDSGIGFAIPMEHIQQVLPRLKKGEDLYPGQAGITLKGPNASISEPIIVVSRPKGPVTAAGIKSGDRIVEIDGRAMSRAADAREELGRHYAGDTLRMTVLRGKQRIQREIKLAAKVEPFQQGFFGILPMRSADEKGVAVRYVYPKSPAATAGIAAGDVLVSLGGEPIENRDKLIEKISLLEPGAVVEVEVSRADAVRKLKATLASLPEGLPPDALPPGETPSAKETGKAADPGGPKLGETPLKLAEYSNEVWAYVPEKYAANVPYGVVVWLHAPGGYVEWKELLARWKPLCDRHDLILVAPKSSDPARWESAEAALVDALLKEVASTYHVDPARIVVHGYKGGGSLAFQTAFQNREMIRGVAAVEAAPGGPPPENEPSHRLAIYMAVAKESKAAPTVERAAGAIRQMKYPVTVKKLGQQPRYLTDAELAELARWIDTLDRI